MNGATPPVPPPPSGAGSQPPAPPAPAAARAPVPPPPAPDVADAPPPAPLAPFASPSGTIPLPPTPTGLVPPNGTTGWGDPASASMTPAWGGGQAPPEHLGFSDQTYTAGSWSPAATATLVPRPEPPAGIEPFSIAAIVTAVLLPPVGFVLGVVALVRTRRTRQRGAVLAAVALFVAVLLTVLLAMVPTLAPTLLPRLQGVTSPVGPEVDRAVGAHVRQLTVGSCVRDLPDGSTDRVTVVPCTDEHAVRVVSEYTFDDDSWPGSSAVRREVAESCTLSAEEAAAGVRAVALVPTKESWRQGDRTGLCLLTTSP